VTAVPDVLIIGAGIIGAAAAYYLTADGARVLLVDADVPGGGTTAGGMGHIVVMDDSPAQLALTTWSRELLLGLDAELPATCEVEHTGTLWLAEDDVQFAAARAKGDDLARHGIRAELLDAMALAALEPALRPGLAGALLVADDLVIYPPGLARWLLDEAVRRGARVLPRTRIATVQGRTATSTGGERFTADVIVNAAGAAASLLTDGLPIEPRKGHLVITDRYPRLCRHELVELGYLGSAHSLTDESSAFNLQPRRTGQLLIGSSRELVGWDASVNRRLLSIMLQRAVSFVPSLASMNAIRVWTAFRPATPDHLPVIGHAGAHLLVAAGHEGLGITTALGTGRIVADLVAARTPAIDAAPFSPQRFTQQATA
jgi:D-hydroxyproline dehydrogenase subunit beta